MSRVITERCGGGKCPLKKSCRMYLIPVDNSKVSVLFTPSIDGKGNVFCHKFQDSTIEKVMAEIRELKLISMQ
jgi:hypothetical protein